MLPQGSNLSSLGEEGTRKNDWPKSKLDKQAHKKTFNHFTKVKSSRGFLGTSGVIPPLVRSEWGERRAKHRGKRER